MITLLALFGTVLSANLKCKECAESAKDGECASAADATCGAATDICYMITYKKGTDEKYKKGCATPTEDAATAATVFGLVAADVTELKAEWCNTALCEEYSPRLTCKTCAVAEVDDIDALCNATDSSALCGFDEQCASVFYMKTEKAYNERMCKEYSDPKEWVCADNKTQSACGIKFCKTDNCEDYSSSMATTIALPLLLVAIFNAYF